MYLTEKEATTLTGYKRTSLYKFRVTGAIRWTASKGGRKVRYHRADLLKVAGLPANTPAPTTQLKAA